MLSNVKKASNVEQVKCREIKKHLELHHLCENHKWQNSHALNGYDL